MIKLVGAAAANQVHARLSCVTEISAPIHGVVDMDQVRAIGIVAVQHEHAEVALALPMTQQAMVVMAKGVPATQQI